MGEINSKNSSEQGKSHTEKPFCYERKSMKVEVEPGTTIYWCACGKSKNQPYCDGSHAGTSFQPMAYTAKDGEKKLKLCLCRRTKKPPFCDGIHKDNSLDW